MKKTTSKTNRVANYIALGGSSKEIADALHRGRNICGDFYPGGKLFAAFVESAIELGYGSMEDGVDTGTIRMRPTGVINVWGGEEWTLEYKARGGWHTLPGYEEHPACI